MKKVNIEVDSIAWDSAKEILEEYNMSVSDAINIFLDEVNSTSGFPFDFKEPNAKTQQAMKDADDNIGETISYDKFMKEIKADDT